MSTAVQTMTAEQFYHYAGDRRMELIDGEVRMMAPSGGEHGGINNLMGYYLTHFVLKTKCGRLFNNDTGFIVGSDPDVVLCPDLAFIRQENLPATGIPKGFFEQAPDLVVEVISPHDRYTEIADKVDRWLAAGVELVWVIDPRQKSVAVHELNAETKYLSSSESLGGGKVIPGFVCRVKDLFE